MDHPGDRDERVLRIENTPFAALHLGDRRHRIEHNFEVLESGRATADAGINAQTAMRLAGHSQMATHMRYVVATSGPLEIPAEMLPKLGVYARSVQKLRGSKNKPERFQHAWCDSNARPLASEANALSS